MPASLALASVVALAGCGSSQEAAVSAAAGSFATAIEDRDGATACEMLAPHVRSELSASSGRACPVSVLEEAASRIGAEVQVRVFGTMAQVRFEDDTLFLGRYREGWQVTAAACTRAGEPAYDCRIKGA